MRQDRLERFINNNYWTNTLGLGRSLLALSTLLTLCFNSQEVLFYSGINNQNTPKIQDLSINIYTWFPELAHGYYFSIIVLILVLIGIYPRITCVFHWLVTFSFLTTTALGDGGDQIASILTLLLIPVCIFDKRKWHWSSIEYTHNFYTNSIAAIFYELIRIQMFVIYFFASVGKFPSEEWKNGTALYYWFNEPLFGVNEFYLPFVNIILESPILTSLSTWSVLVLELSLAFAYFISSQKTRMIFLFMGVFFHFMIVLFFGLISFYFVMAAGLIFFLISKNFNYEYRNFNLIITIRSKLNLLFSTSKKHKLFLRLSNKKIYENY